MFGVNCGVLLILSLIPQVCRVHWVPSANNWESHKPMSNPWMATSLVPTDHRNQMLFLIFESLA